MKTNLLLKNSLLIVFSTIVAISCTKESTNLLSSTSQDNQLKPVAGTIVDYGLIDSNIRVMKAALVTEDFALISSNEEVLGKSAFVNVSFYVNSDYQITPGEYFYTDSEIKSAFTFDSATINGVVDSNGNEAPDERIINGSIMVSQDAGNYVFTFNCNFDSGVTFSGKYNGLMNYSDYPEGY